MNDIRNFVLRSIKLGEVGLSRNELCSLFNFDFFEFDEIVKSSQKVTLSAFGVMGVFFKE